MNGVERKVTFDTKDSGIEVQVVQSLAKWKRKALKDYGFRVGKGLYCDMNAIRRDEDMDNLHSIYVDQWDWEKVIREEDRNETYLKNVVRSIVSAVCATEMNLHAMFPQLQDLPLHTPNVTFITTQELEDKYPDLTPKERENAIVKENGTTFLMKIGAPRRLGSERRPAVLERAAAVQLRAEQHGHPCQPREHGPPAHRRRLRRPPRAALPQGCAER